MSFGELRVVFYVFSLRIRESEKRKRKEMCRSLYIIGQRPTEED